MSLCELNTREKSDQGISVDILHPKTSQPIGIRFVILGGDSETARAMLRKQQTRRLGNAQRNRNALSRTPDEIEADNVELLAACTREWFTGNEATIEITPGEWVPCTPENAARLYTDPGFAWLREQIDREIGDRANFLKV